MLGKRQTLKVGVIGAAMTLLATPAFARSIELKGAGTALWIFLIIGAIIVLRKKQSALSSQLSARMKRTKTISSVT